MKKVSVITLHRVTNFGSLLQTYATETVLHHLGYDVEIVDFVPEGLTFRRAIWPQKGNIIKKCVKIIPLIACNLFQFHMSDSFLRQYVTLSEQKYHNYAELMNHSKTADIYVSGSDQVWNTQNNNPEEDLGAYYLAFVNNKPKIAYAGSFGREDFSDKEKTKIKHWLEKYSSISVREDSGLKLITDMGLKGKHVVDPTFLLNRQDWIEFYSAKRKDLPEKGYVFVYNLNRNKVIESIAKKLAAKKGLRIINFADTFEFLNGAKNKLFNSPFDFLGYIANADYVITDSFHGTSFSINLERQFITVAAPKYNCRIESVLRMMHCENRLVTSVEDALKRCEQKIDYSLISFEVNMQRNLSLKFLESALYECEHNR